MNDQQQSRADALTGINQFLMDVVTAAGLLSHGRADKKLATRITDQAYELRKRMYFLAASPVEQPALLTAQDALAAIETFEIVGDNNDSREPNAEDQFILTEFVAHLFGGFRVELPAAAPADGACKRCGSTTAQACNDAGCFYLESGDGEPSAAPADERTASFEAWCDRFPEISAVERLRDAWQEARAAASPAAERVTAALQALSADVHTLGDGWANDEAMIGLAKKYLRVEPKPASLELSLWRDFVLLAVTDTAPQPAQADAPVRIEALRKGLFNARDALRAIYEHGVTRNTPIWQWIEDANCVLSGEQADAPAEARERDDPELIAASNKGYAAGLRDGKALGACGPLAPADAGEAREPIGPHDLSTTAGGRSYVAEFFAKRLRRHDFGRYITGQLAADFACSLAAYLRDHDHAAADAGEAQPYAYVAPVSNYATRNKIVADRIGGLIPVYTAQPAARVASLTDAARDMLAERRRQVEAEGWTPKHDDEHDKGEMARAAACYALHAGSCFAWRADAYQSAKPHEGNPAAQDSLWPWDMQWWKPKDPRRDLVRAGALILAELERLDRATLLNGADKS
ncbi:gp43 [Burkholderia pseudomallei]|nr:gp43 [Burkholderia pseudomallei]